MEPEKPMHTFRLFLVFAALAVLLAACASTEKAADGPREKADDGPLPEEAPAELTAQIPDGVPSMRGERTCELYELRIDGEMFILDIWNNRDLHDCPDDWLAQIDESAFYVGGPRWRSVDAVRTIDENGNLVTSIVPPAEDSLAEVPPGLGLQMSLAATVSLVEVAKIERRDGIEVETLDDVPVETRQMLLESPSANPYEMTQVDRLSNTLMRFTAGQPVYTLSDSRCTYAMKFFTSKFNPRLQDEAALVGMGAEMTELPEGWAYEVQTFEEDTYVVDTDNKQFVVEDEFGNTYDLFSCG